MQKIKIMPVSMESFVIIFIISLAIPTVPSYFLQEVDHNSNDLAEIWTALGQTQGTTTSDNNSNSTSPLKDLLTEEENIRIYENSTYGIIMAFPSTWEVYNPINSPEDRNIFIVEFNVPNTPASLFVARDIFDKNKTLSTYLAETVESYSQDIPGFTLLSSDLDSAQLAGNPGYSLLFTSGDNETGDGITLTKEIGTIIADTDMVYYIQYVANINQYSLYETVADQMIDSLEIHIQDTNTTQTVEEQDLTDLLEEMAANAGEI
jgi:hypothetical protein